MPFFHFTLKKKIKIFIKLQKSPIVASNVLKNGEKKHSFITKCLDIKITFTVLNLKEFFFFFLSCPWTIKWPRVHSGLLPKVPIQQCCRVPLGV